MSAVCTRGNRKVLTQAVLSCLSCATKGSLRTHEQAVAWSNPAHNSRLLGAGLAELLQLATQPESPASTESATGLVGYLTKHEIGYGSDI